MYIYIEKYVLHGWIVQNEIQHLRQAAGHLMPGMEKPEMVSFYHQPSVGASALFTNGHFGKWTPHVETKPSLYDIPFV